MPTLDRRTLLRAGMALSVPPGAIALLGGCLRVQDGSTRRDSADAGTPPDGPGSSSMRVQYLEVVTTDVDGICAQYARVLGLAFRDPDPALGGARTATLAGGGMLGIRAPLRDTESPVVRPYVLVDDIEAAVSAAAASGAIVALPPMPLPGHGTCAIVVQGGIECGLWQL
ncbi:MAG: hypothetical protein KF817_04555 [Phycisphaeraceae bacterium]|nr:hypothetical protein [Phycisphaeraceae bacterium]